MRFGSSLSYAIVSVVALLVGSPAIAQEAPSDWRFSVTPYIWLPTVKGDFRFDVPPGAGGRPDVKVGPVDYLKNLQGVLMVAGEARYRRFGAFTDFIYLDLANEDAAVRSVTGPGPLQIPIDVGTQAALTGKLWTIAGGYDFVDNQDWRLQAFAGARLLDVQTSANWRLSGPLDLLPQSGEVSRKTDAWDGVVGVRGEANTGHWTFPYYADIGSGESNLTWQASLGVGYRFSWAEISASYRALHYEQDASKLIQGLDLSGPSFNATFRF